MPVTWLQGCMPPEPGGGSSGAGGLRGAVSVRSHRVSAGLVFTFLRGPMALKGVGLTQSPCLAPWGWHQALQS